MRTDLSFGRWLKHRRLDLSLTQEELARRVDYSTVTIRKIESEELRPSRQMAEKLADQLELDPEERAAFVRFARGKARGQELHLSGGLLRPSHQALPFEPLPNNLPAPTAQLIGRQREVEAAHHLLLRRDVRLITFTGPGGTGKTRVALRVAEEASVDFADRIVFVDLAPIADPALVIPTIATTLAVRETPGQALVDTLGGYLRTKHLLLLLDNFEQVLTAAAQVAQLLRAAPRLKVLVTSRVPLRLQGEHQFPVPPLSVPDLEHIAEPPPLPLDEWASHYSAIELLVRCARAVRPDFTLNAGNALAVAEVCARLDGLPLAIELAAARIKVASPSDLLAQLGSRLKLLAHGGPACPSANATRYPRLEPQSAERARAGAVQKALGIQRRLHTGCH